MHPFTCSTTGVRLIMRLAIAALSLLALFTSTDALAKRVAVPGDPKPVACTMEAKICPDGSSVSRSGPNCEFARCPDGTTPVIQTPAPDSQTTPPADDTTGGGASDSDGKPGATSGSPGPDDGGTPDDTPPPGDADE